MNREPVVLIFDIGKTAKKASIFDMHFHVLEEQSESFPEVTDDDEFPSDDLARVSEWVLTKFQQYTTHEKYNVTHCNISSYGASLVHLDGEGKRIEHFYNYLKPFPENCRQQFLSDYDSQQTLLADTASPFLGMLNSGLQLYWLKYEKKALFQTVKTSLHLPQYFTYLLTGKTFADITSVGCHTLLWDFKKQDYHSWVDAEDLRELFPPLYAADHVFDFKVNHHALKIGIGVHDSSAALMPYLATQQEPFLLLSSGTWNICFNPFNHDPLTSHELAGDCLCFLTPIKKGTPVKASRIFLGHEHDQQTTALNKFFGTAPDYYKSIAFNEDLYRALASSPQGTKEFFPIAMEGTGPIPQKQTQRTDYTQFETFDQAYHQCIRYLVKWQLLSMDLIDPGKKVKNVIVVGGFTKNPLFLEILKHEDPQRKILISDHPRASALGAAWLVAGEASYRGKAGLLSVSSI